MAAVRAQSGFRPMTLRTRFNLLLVLLCLGLAASLLVLRYYEKRETNLILNDLQGQRSRMLDRLIELSGRSLETFTRDYSLWTEMVDFVAQPVADHAWAAVNIDASLTTFNAQAAWVFKPDGTLFYATAADGAVPPTTVLPPGPALAERLQRDKVCHFFIQTPTGLAEIRGAVIVPSDDAQRTSTPQGFLLAAVNWDSSHLKRLADLSQAHVALAKPDAVHLTEQNTIHLYRDLPAWDGQVLRELHVRYASTTLEFISDTDAWESAILFTFGVVAILLGAWFTRRWVLVPLGHISESLATGTTEPLGPLLSERTELGRVAELVRTSFEDRAKLRHTLDERAQLSRDLHDGLIQTLYAIGMNLASIGPLLRQQPEQAEEAIDQSRAELNASIRELRSFISRLEPTATEKDFAKAVQLLVDFMQTAAPTVRIDVTIDETLAAKLPVEQCTQLLYIVREALSNAVRHSRGDRIAVSLQPTGEAAVVLAVQDNGRGFDPSGPRVGGHGLDNMAERALQLGGELELKSQPGHGTLVTIRLPFPT